MRIAWGILILVVGATLLVGFRRRALQQPIFALFRVVFPSFRFFDDVAEQPLLYVRWAEANGELGPWHLALQAPERRVLHVLWNPAGNLHLAQCALLERLISDLAEHGAIAEADAEALTSYRMVARLAHEAAERLVPHASRVQFKLCEGPQDLLVSRENSLPMVVT